MLVSNAQKKSHFEMTDHEDCEGLRGSDLSAAGRIQSVAIRGSSQTVGPMQDRSLRSGRPALADVDRLKRVIKEHQRTASSMPTLQWGNCRQWISYEDEPTHVDSRTRSTIVKELYPRLLYAFSDVVCYITNNPK